MKLKLVFKKNIGTVVEIETAELALSKIKEVFELEEKLNAIPGVLVRVEEVQN